MKTNPSSRVAIAAAGGLFAALSLFANARAAEAQLPLAEGAVEDRAGREAVDIKVFLHRAGVQAGSGVLMPPVAGC